MTANRNIFSLFQFLFGKIKGIFSCRFALIYFYTFGNPPNVRVTFPRVSFALYLEKLKRYPLEGKRIS
jgi:hypothetical protein